MRITVNGEGCATKARTLDELCQELGLAGAKVATAINGAFVPAMARGQQTLSEGDAVEVVSPRQGG